MMLNIRYLGSYENLNIFLLLDGAALAGCISLIIGRIGCYNYGCCYGKPTQSCFNVKYSHKDSKILRMHPELKNVPLVPTQLISASFDFILFTVLVSLTYLDLKDGFLAVIFIIFYNLFRVWIHKYRANDTAAGNKQTADQRAFLILATVLSGLGVLLALSYAIFYDKLPASPDIKAFNWDTYIHYTLLNPIFLLIYLVIGVMYFVIYGYHKKLGQHF